MKELKYITQAEIDGMGCDDLIDVSDNLAKLKKLEESYFIPPIPKQVHDLLNQLADLHKKSNIEEASG